MSREDSVFSFWYRASEVFFGDVLPWSTQIAHPDGQDYSVSLVIKNDNLLLIKSFWKLPLSLQVYHYSLWLPRRSFLACSRRQLNLKVSWIKMRALYEFWISDESSGAIEITDAPTVRFQILRESNAKLLYRKSFESYKEFKRFYEDFFFEGLKDQLQLINISANEFLLYEYPFHEDNLHRFKKEITS